MGIPTDYNPSVFHRELKKIYGIVPLSPTDSPTDSNPSVFHKELKKIYRIMPLSPTNLSTDKNPSVFHIELQKNYGIVPQSPTSTPTALPTYNTDWFTHIPKRTHVWYVSVCTNTDDFTDVQYRQIYAHPEAHACLTRVRLHKYRRIEKSGGTFELFSVHISINFRRYYRRNLMPPTTINFHR